MTLEETLTYLVALAVPVWLLVEQIIVRRRARGEREALRRGAELPTPAELEAPNGSSPDPVTGGLRRGAGAADYGAWITPAAESSVMRASS